MPLQLVVAVPTFICSSLSLLAGIIFAVFFISSPPEWHFRQALIVSLLVADFINSANNTISGAIALSRRHDLEALTPGPACTANGFIGQFSVQAIDFNILVISIAVLLTVRQSHLIVAPPVWQIVVVCAVPWIPPLITASVALGLGAYVPVSGNWCWIKQDSALRYGLTHGWRLAIFVVTVAIYTYVWIALMRVYREESESVWESSGSGSRCLGAQCQMPSDEVPVLRDEDEGNMGLGELVKLGGLERTGSAKCGHVEAARIQASVELTRKKALRKMLLLKGYPILYILLWTPGIANRIVESVSVSPTWLKALQASTQLVGLANALTYAWSERLSGNIGGWWRRTHRRA